MGKLTLIAAALAGVVAGWCVRDLMLPARPVRETAAPAPAVVLADGGMIAERPTKPAEVAPSPRVPAGYTEQRRARVVVKPRPVVAGCECSPVIVDTSQIAQGGDVRELVHVSGGDIVSATAAPVVRMTLPADPPTWGASVMYAPTTRGRGVGVSHEIGRISLGITLTQSRPSAEVVPWIAAGVRW